MMKFKNFYLTQISFAFALFFFFLFGILLFLLSDSVEYWRYLKVGVLMSPFPSWFIEAIITYDISLVGITVSLIMVCDFGFRLLTWNVPKNKNLRFPKRESKQDVE